MKTSLSSLATLGAILLLLLCTQVMNGTLSLLSFERQQLATVLAGYDAVGANVAGKISRSLRLGKSLEHYIGINELLEQVRQTARGLENVSIVGRNGETLSSLQPEPLLPAELAAGVPAGGGKSLHLQRGDDHFVLFPLEGRGGDPAGYLCLAFTEKSLQNQRLAIVAEGLKVLGLSTVFAALALVVMFGAYLAWPGVGRSLPITWMLLLILGGAQLASSAYNFSLFKGYYLELVRAKAHTVGRLQKHEVEELLRRGLQLTALVKIDQQLQSTVDRVPELASLSIEDREGQILYRGERKGDRAEIFEHLELAGKNGEVGRLGIGLDTDSVHVAVKEIAYDSLTIVALSLLFIMELVFFLSATLLFTSPAETDGPRQADQGRLVRTAIFLFIFAASLCYSFIPLHMAEIYRPLAGFSRQMVLGLPLALEMLGGGLILIPVGLWIDRQGWHRPFLAGSGLALAGTAASGLAAEPLVFMAARLVTGIGYGMAWSSAQGYVLQNAGPRDRARGISNVVAGIFSGVICGNGMGALIAERLGYGRVFLIGAGVMAAGLLFVLLFMRRTFTAPANPPSGTGRRWGGLLRLLGDSQVLLLFACSLVPYSIGMVGLLYYVTPLYLKELGTSQSDIGRVIMLFGLCMIFLAPRVGHLADRLPDKRRLVICGGVLAAASLCIFFLAGRIWIVPLAVILFGISVSVSGAARNVLMLNIPVSRELGASQVMGVYRSVDKLGQTLGAMVPATLMTWLDIRATMLVMGGAYLLLTLLLALRLRPHLDR